METSAEELYEEFDKLWVGSSRFIKQGDIKVDMGELLTLLAGIRRLMLTVGENAQIFDEEGTEENRYQMWSSDEFMNFKDFFELFANKYVVLSEIRAKQASLYDSGKDFARKMNEAKKTLGEDVSKEVLADMESIIQSDKKEYFASKELRQCFETLVAEKIVRHDKETKEENLSRVVKGEKIRPYPYVFRL